MTEKKPTFFAGRRLGVYFRCGRLMKDRKTGQRFWRLKWALTVHASDAYACGGAIQSTYEHIQARENAAEEITLSGARGGMVIRVFDGASDDAPRVIRLDRCFLDQFRMTYAEGMTEFWIQVEHDLTDALHAFVKDYAFQRFFVEFEDAQGRLVGLDLVAFAEKVAEVASEPGNAFQKMADEQGISTTILREGKTLAEFKPKGKVQ